MQPKIPLPRSPPLHVPCIYEFNTKENFSETVYGASARKPKYYSVFFPTNIQMKDSALLKDKQYYVYKY